MPSSARRHPPDDRLARSPAEGGEGLGGKRPTAPDPDADPMTRTNQARSAAYDVVQAVLRGDDLPRALAAFRDRLADDRDRALVTEMAGGTFRWLAALDHVVERAADRPIARIDQDVLTVLRLGAYQLLYLDRVPAAAAVNESVRLVKQVGRTSAAGFVNAVLRRVAATRQAPGLPPPPGEAGDRETVLAYLTVTGSHPRWIVERWLDRYGFQAVAGWIRFNNTAPPLTLRANRLRTTRQELAQRLAEHDVQTEPTRFALDGLTVVAGNPYRTPLASRGLFLAQDEASQLVAELVGARPGERILDACAAPGGKTTAIAGAMDRRGMLVAADLRPARVRLLRQTLAGMGAATAGIVRFDLRRGVPFAPVFDRVLVDAPCTGLGVLRRDPEIRWRRRPADLPRFAAEQLSMAGHAAGAVRPGGHLVYATCSSEPDENEDVVAAFLDAHPDFEPVHPDRSGRIAPGLRQVLDDRGHLSTTPPDHQLDAFFAVVLRRRVVPRRNAGDEPGKRRGGSAQAPAAGAGNARP